jgi:hypothetical protein
MEIRIPFRSDMIGLILEGKKTCTTRTRKYGREGDTFSIGSNVFVITEVKKMRLIDIVNTLYEEEGFTSPVEFKEYLSKVGIPMDEYAILWVHKFKRM